MDLDADELPEDRAHRKREYSGAGSTLGVAALIVLAVGVAIWWFEVRGGGGGGITTEGFGIVELPDAANGTGQPPASRIGRAAPNFRLATLDGASETLDSYRGKWVLINFWASWCGPCRSETPDLQRFWERAGDAGAIVIGVNQQEPPGTVRDFVGEFQPTYPIVLDRTGEVSDAYAVGRGLPVTFLIDPAGVIREVYPGRITAEQLATIETDYLAAARAPAGRRAG